jgi:hypothetical protein
MRTALRRTAPRRRQVAQAKPIPAPVKGLDLISPLTAMDPQYAIQLDNLFCQPGYVELRRDRVVYADLSLATTPVESLLPYNGPETDALFAAAGTAIYNVTTGTASSALTGLANARWQHVNFATSGGNFLWICNGADTPRTYDGSAFATATISGTVAGSDIIQVAAHKNRLWFVEAGTTDAHFLNVDSIQGTASAFPLGGLFTKGGFLQAIATWSRDGGNGPDDLICFASSRGQVAIYAGTNPAGGGDFAVVGVFDTAPPIGRRCFTKVGADLAVVTIDGVLPLSRALVTDRGASLRISLTQRIQPAVAGYGRTNGSMFGWQLTSYPRGPAAILNIPQVENSTALQYVMNTVTGAWSRYTGWNANCFEVFRDRLFFGGPDGKVYEADRGGVGSNSTLAVDMRTAFNYFGSRGRKKHFKALRGIPGGDGRVAPGFALNVDFRDDEPLAVASTAITSQALWDAAAWDAAAWATEDTVNTNWLTTKALGNCASLRMAFTLERPATSSSLWDEFLWDEGYWDDADEPAIVFQASAFDILYEPGAPM